MNKNIFLIAAVGIGLLMMNKTASAKAPAASKSAPIVNNNINDDMWKKILGGAWTQFTNGDSAGFLKRNLFGQVVSSDGTPITTGDVATDYGVANLGFTQEQMEYGKQGFFATEAMTAKDPLDPMDGFRNPYAYWGNGE